MFVPSTLPQNSSRPSSAQARLYPSPSLSPIFPLPNKSPIKFSEFTGLQMSLESYEFPDRMSPVQFVDSERVYTSTPNGFLQRARDVNEASALKFFSSTLPPTDQWYGAWERVKKSFQYHHRPETYSPSFRGCSETLFMQAFIFAFKKAESEYPHIKNIISEIILLVEQCLDFYIAIGHWGMSRSEDEETSWYRFISEKLASYIEGSHKHLLFPLGWLGDSSNPGHFFLCLLEKMPDEQVKVKIFDTAPVNKIAEKTCLNLKGQEIHIATLPTCSWELVDEDPWAITEHLERTIQAKKPGVVDALIHNRILKTIGDGKLSISPKREGPLSEIDVITGNMCIPESFLMFVFDFFRMHLQDLDDPSATEALCKQLIDDVCLKVSSD